MIFSCEILCLPPQPGSCIHAFQLASVVKEPDTPLHTLTGHWHLFSQTQTCGSRFGSLVILFYKIFEGTGKEVSGAHRLGL